MFDGILFDLDGTLWDSTPSMEGVWADFLAAHPAFSRPPVTLAEIQGNMGLLLEDIGRRMFPHLSLPQAMEALAQFNVAEERYLAQHGGTLFPQAEAVLEQLSARCPLYIVSNCQDGYIECFYQGNGLARFFSGHECAGRTGRPKSENIKLVVARYGLKNPVYIGDTALDCTSAREAGVPFLHAAYGFGQAPDAMAVQSFAEIPSKLLAMSPP